MVMRGGPDGHPRCNAFNNIRPRALKGVIFPQLRLRAVSAAIACVAALPLANGAFAAEALYDFRSQSGDARAWLNNKGFVFQRDEPGPEQIRYDFDSRGLTIRTVAAATSVATKELPASDRVRQPAQLTVMWGVSQYPTGANWDQGQRREALMLVVSFGEKLV